LPELTDVLAACHTVAVDVPIGLSDTQARGCDLAAKKALGVRHSSLFLTPVRPALLCDTHAEATKTNHALTGQGISIQAFGLRQKIGETEQFLHTFPKRLYETHPELCFTHLTGAPLSAAKTTWAGVIQRINALATVGITLDTCLPAGAKCGADDMLDAAVASNTARRIAHNQAIRYGSASEHDPHSGVELAIYA